jgi:hypothetical protein
MDRIGSSETHKDVLGKKRRHAFSRMNPRTFPSHLHRAQMMKTSLQGFKAEY